MRIILLAFAIVILLFACRNNSEFSESLSFNIDSARIAEKQIIDGFAVSFHPPLNWTLVDADISERIVNSLKSQREDNSKYIYKPDKIYLNKFNNSLLAVGTVSTNSDGFADQLNEYKGVVSENFKDSITKKGSYTKDSIDFTQFLIQKQNLVSFKLIFELNQTIYQFDYTSQKDNYMQEIKSIESSMGTIKPITN